MANLGANLIVAVLVAVFWGWDCDDVRKQRLASRETQEIPDRALTPPGAPPTDE